MQTICLDYSVLSPTLLASVPFLPSVTYIVAVKFDLFLRLLIQILYKVFMSALVLVICVQCVFSWSFYCFYYSSLGYVLISVLTFMILIYTIIILHTQVPPPGTNNLLLFLEHLIIIPIWYFLFIIHDQGFVII